MLVVRIYWVISLLWCGLKMLRFRLFQWPVARGSCMPMYTRGSMGYSVAWHSVFGFGCWLIPVGEAGGTCNLHGSWWNWEPRTGTLQKTEIERRCLSPRG